MKTASILVGLTLVLSICCGCSKKKEEGQTPCERLYLRQAECEYSKGIIVGQCEDKQNTLWMRSALNCLNAKDCKEFNRCRQQADELKNLKTGLENIK